MTKPIGKILIVVAALAALWVIVAIVRLAPFFAMQEESNKNAGTWEDDPKNWSRAFDEEPPSAIKVVHSKYWRSNHFTYEFSCYFEVEATPEWRDRFLAQRKLQRVSPSAARSYRSRNQSQGIPNWYAPDPVDRYEVWDLQGQFGSVWIDKASGHIFFHDSQL